MSNVAQLSAGVANGNVRRTACTTMRWGTNKTRRAKSCSLGRARCAGLANVRNLIGVCPPWTGHFPWTAQLAGRAPQICTWQVIYASRGRAGERGSSSTLSTPHSMRHTQKSTRSPLSPAGAACMHRSSCNLSCLPPPPWQPVGCTGSCAFPRWCSAARKNLQGI